MLLKKFYWSIISYKNILKESLNKMIIVLSEDKNNHVFINELLKTVNKLDDDITKYIFNNDLIKNNNQFNTIYNYADNYCKNIINNTTSLKYIDNIDNIYRRYFDGCDDQFKKKIYRYSKDWDDNARANNLNLNLDILHRSKCVDINVIISNNNMVKMGEILYAKYIDIKLNVDGGSRKCNKLLEYSRLNNNFYSQSQYKYIDIHSFFNKIISFYKHEYEKCGRIFMNNIENIKKGTTLVLSSHHVQSIIQKNNIKLSYNQDDNKNCILGTIKYFLDKCSNLFLHNDHNKCDYLLEKNTKYTYLYMNTYEYVIVWYKFIELKNEVLEFIDKFEKVYLLEKLNENQILDLYAKLIFLYNNQYPNSNIMNKWSEEYEKKFHHNIYDIGYVFYRLINGVFGLQINIIINKYIVKLYTTDVFDTSDIRNNDNLEQCNLLTKISHDDRLSVYMKNNHCYTHFLIININDKMNKINKINSNHDERYRFYLNRIIYILYKEMYIRIDSEDNDTGILLNSIYDDNTSVFNDYLKHHNRNNRAYNINDNKKIYDYIYNYIYGNTKQHKNDINEDDNGVAPIFVENINSNLYKIYKLKKTLFNKFKYHTLYESQDENYRKDAYRFISRVICIIKLFLDELNSNHMNGTIYNTLTKINLFRQIHIKYHFRNVLKMNLSNIEQMINGTKYELYRSANFDKFEENHNHNLYTNYFYQLKLITEYNFKRNHEKDKKNDFNYEYIPHVVYPINSP